MRPRVAEACWRGGKVCMSTDHRLRCQSFVLRTRGAWSTTARARLDTLLEKRGATGPTDSTLAALSQARSENAVYVCVGSSCSRMKLTACPEDPAVPHASSGLPVRETACLGPCRLAPSAHRVIHGRGETFTGLNDQLLERLIKGASDADLLCRRWRAGETSIDPRFASIVQWLGHWQGPGGFRHPTGCVRSLSIQPALGGAFLELCLESAWPTLVDRADRFPERILLRPSPSAADPNLFEGQVFDYLGQTSTLRASLAQDTLTFIRSDHSGQRRILEWTGPDTLSERHERHTADGWKVGLCAQLQRIEQPAAGMLR